MKLAAMFWKFYMLWARIFWRLKIEGIENFPKEGGLVIVFNHIAPAIDGITGGIAMQSRQDVAVFGGAALPRGGLLAKFTSSRETGEDTYFLSAVKAQGMSGIELFKALNILKEGRAVALAAEGEISWDGELQYPLAPGAAWMALRGHVPVIACCSIGGYDVMPRWAKLPRLFGKVTIRIGKPFYVRDEPITQLTEELLTEANDRIFNEMAAVIGA
jgi:1-acyl-sn-glycerol-3-phosphate acyltransferase